jgi:hypothetical protein
LSDFAGKSLLYLCGGILTGLPRSGETAAAGTDIVVLPTTNADPA